MSLNEKKTVLLSVLIHVILLLSLNFIKSVKPVKDKWKKIDVVLKKQPTKTIAKNNKSIKKRQSKKKKRKFIPLNNLMPNMNFDFKKESLNRDEKAEDLKEMVEGIEELPFLNQIWRRVNTKFYLPEIFNKMLIQGGGVINVRVNPDGSLASEVLYVESSDNIRWS